MATKNIDTVTATGNLIADTLYDSTTGSGAGHITDDATRSEYCGIKRMSSSASRISLAISSWRIFINPIISASVKVTALVRVMNLTWVANSTGVIEYFQLLCCHYTAVFRQWIPNTGIRY